MHLERILDYLNDDELHHLEEGLEEGLEEALPDDINEAIAKIEELGKTHHIYYSVLQVRRSLMEPVHETQNTPET